LDERNPRVLRIRQPWEAAPPTPGPEEWEEDDDDEFLRREELQDNLGVQASSSSCGAFRRLGLLAPGGRDAEPRAGRLEGATSPGSRGQLRLLGHPSKAPLQWYLTLRRSDAMGTCKVKGAWISTPSSPATPASAKPEGQSQALASLTFPSSFHCPSQFSAFRRCKALRRNRDGQRSTDGFGLGFPIHSVTSEITKRFSLHRATSETPKRFRDCSALRYSLQHKALHRCQRASKHA
jgi:hypothetical protein